MAKHKSKNMNVMPVIDPKWQAEDDLRTIRRAAEIQGSKQRMSAVRKLAIREQDALKRVTDMSKATRKGNR